MSSPSLVNTVLLNAQGSLKENSKLNSYTGLKPLPSETNNLPQHFYHDLLLSHLIQAGLFKSIFGEFFELIQTND